MRTSATGTRARTADSRTRRRGGFTAIELMLVLAVLVVCASVILPSYPGYVRSQRLQATSARLSAMVRYAADWSVLHERPLTLSYNEEERLFALAVEETDSTAGLVARPVPVTETGAAVEEEQQATTEPESARALLRLPEDVSFEAQEVSQEGSSDSTRVRFLPDGRCDDAVFVLAAGEQRRSIRIDGNHGRVRIEDGDVLVAGPQEGRAVAQ